MPKSDFAQRLAESVDLEAQPNEFQAAYTAIQEMAVGILRLLKKGTKKPIHVKVEPGYTTNLGTQLNLVVEIPSRKYQWILLRAYVPSGGTPISLDFIGEDVTKCNDIRAMEDEVIKFLNRPAVLDTLRTLRTLAS